MATHDRFPLEPVVETLSLDSDRQGELFARIALRRLPLMKEGPEDAWIDTGRTLH